MKSYNREHELHLLNRLEQQAVDTSVMILVNFTLKFYQNALEDLSYWVKKDRRKAEKILALVQEIAKDPCKGMGKPEPLKYSLAGCWSRRIDQEHRTVYSIESEKIRILTCRFHY